jgi:hypothetical protein
MDGILDVAVCEYRQSPHSIVAVAAQCLSPMNPSLLSCEFRFSEWTWSDFFFAIPLGKCPA